MHRIAAILLILAIAFVPPLEAAGKAACPRAGCLTCPKRSSRGQCPRAEALRKGATFVRSQRVVFWKTLFHPGQFGGRRDKLFAGWDKRYGKGNWRVAWTYGKRALDLDGALALYENGYYHYLRKNEDKLDWLCRTARDVYDNAPSNVKSGFDYHAQETDSNHYQDIAIRRVLRRLGRSFEGDRLVQIRGRKTEGWFLSPGEIPFHRPRLIANTNFQWWKKGTIEDFWQRNKCLVARRAKGAPWEVREHPGFIGRRWKKLEERWNRRYGRGKWKLAYEVEGRMISRDDALKLYEDAYVAYFKGRPDKLDWLCRTAKDVYDHEPADVESGYDYHVQRGRATHLQDIAVRNALRRLGRKFQGKRLIQMRGRNTPGWFLSPGELPFHKPELIAKTRFVWWKKDSIEDFYQSNKAIQVKKVLVKAAVAGMAR